MIYYRQNAEMDIFSISILLRITGAQESDNFLIKRLYLHFQQFKSFQFKLQLFFIVIFIVLWSNNVNF